MADFPLGSLIETVGNYFTSRATNKSNESINKRNIALQEVANQQNALTNQQNMQLQKDFAQMGIRWRMQDAEAAGIHPLAALGATGASYSPVQPVFQAASLQQTGRASAIGSALSGIGGAMVKEGQDVRRAKLAAMTPEELAYQRAQLRGLELDNSIKEFSLMGQAQGAMGNVTGPLGSVGAGTVKVNPSEIISASPDNPSVEAGVHPGSAVVSGPGGLKFRIPGQKVAEGLEDLDFTKYLYMLEDNRRFWFTKEGDPTPAAVSEWFKMAPPLKRGQAWEWNRFKQKFRRVELPGLRRDLQKHGGVVE